MSENSNQKVFNKNVASTLQRESSEQSEVDLENLVRSALAEESQALQLLYGGELIASEIHFVKASQLFLEAGKLDDYLHNQLNYISVSHKFIYKNNLVAVKELRDLEEIAEKNNQLRAKGLIQREKSYLLFDSEIFESSLFEIEQSERLLLSYGEIGDLFLAQIQKCDCYIEVGEKERAEELFEYLKVQYKNLEDSQARHLANENFIDTKVRAFQQFRIAYFYLQARMSAAPIAIENLLSNSFYWTKRAEKLSIGDIKKDELVLLNWFTSTGHFVDSRKRIYGQIKVSSYEGRLIQFLSTQNCGKDEICESLWPGELKSDLLRTRFHSLVKRINYKIRDLIQFDGEKYKLGKKIVLRF